MMFETLMEVRRKEKDSNNCLQLPHEGYREKGCREDIPCLFSEMYKGQWIVMTVCSERNSNSIEKMFFTMRVVKHWDRLPRDIMGSPFSILRHFQNLTGKYLAT